MRNTGMGLIKGPKNPGKALTMALCLGLSATVDLARDCVTADTVHLLVYYQEEMNLQ